MVSLEPPQSQSSAIQFAEIALSYQRQEQWQAAAQYYQQALQLRPHWPEVYYYLGGALEKLDHSTAAIECYRQAIAQKPDYPQAHYSLGLILQRQGQLQAAIDCYQQVIQLDPSQANAYSNIGCLLTQQGQFETAINWLENATQRFPENAIIYNNLAYTLFLHGKLDQAINYYLQALQLDADLIDAQINLGTAFQRQGLHTVAIRYFQQVLDQKQNAITVRSRYAWSLFEQNQIPEALQQFRHVIQQKPQFVEAYIQWLDGIEDQDELNRSRIACGHFLKALLDDINSPTVYQSLAKTYVHLGNALSEYRNYAQAETFYQKAIKIQPQWLAPYLNLGRCFAKQGQLSAAITTYRQGLSVQPDAADLKQQLDETIQQQLQLQETAQKSTKNQVKLPADTPITQPNLPPCGGLECQTCLKRLFAEFEPIHLGDRIYRCTQKPPYLEQEPPTEIAVIPQGRTWIAPRKSWWNVCNAIATIHPNHQLDTTFSRFYPAPLPNCQNPDFSQHQVFSLDEFPPLEYLQGKIVVLSGLSGNVYFHWMVDVLPRLEILKRQGVNFEEIDGFVVNSIQRPFQRETLEKLGIPLSKIIESDRSSYLQAEELIVPAFPSSVGWVSPWIIEFHRQLFEVEMNGPAGDDPKRIYITRKQAQYRRLFNEAEVLECLKGFGFEPLELETLSVEQQARLFAHAEIIIAPHGAGLTNLMFCQPGTRVIELISPHYLRYYYWTIAQQLGLEFYYILGEPFNCPALRNLMYQNPLTEDIFIGIDTIKKALQMTLSSDKIKQSLNHQDSDFILKRPPTQAMVNLSSDVPEAADTRFSEQLKADLKQGQIDSAYQRCVTALQQQPEYAPAYKFLGDIYRSQKRWQEAGKSYGQAIRLQPDYAEAHSNLGSLYAMQKQWQKAIFCYQNATAYKPDSVEIYRNLAKVWEKVNQPIKAGDCWYEAYRLEPNSVKPIDHCQLGEKLLQQGQMTKAAFCFGQALQQDPTLVAAQAGLRQAQHSQQPALTQPTPTTVTVETIPVHEPPVEVQAAVESSELDLSVNLQTPQPSLEVQIPVESPKLDLSANLQTPQPPVEVQTPVESPELDLSANLQPIQDSPVTEVPQLDLSAALDQAQQDCDQKQFEQVIQACQPILQANPSAEQAVAAYVLSGKAFQGMGQTQKAIAAYRQAITLQPGNITAYNNLGSCYALLKQWKEAVVCYQKTIQLQPDLAVAYQNLGRVWKRLGHPDKAVDYFYQAYQVEPELGSADDYHTLGNALLQQGKREQAQNCYCRTLDLNPNHPEAHHNLGELLCTQKQWEDAMAHYRRAIALKPDSYASYNSLGKAYMAMGDLEEALNCYNQAVRLKPELLLAAQNLTAASVTSNTALAQQLPVTPAPATPPVSSSGSMVKAAPEFDVVAHLQKAETYYQQQRYDLCIQACRQTVQWQPKAAGAYLLWGKALAAQDDMIRAKAFYQQAVALQPKDPEAYLALAQLHSQQQQWQEAIPQYQIALQQQPNAAVYRQLAQAYQGVGETEKAQMSVYEALHLEPEAGTLEEYLDLADCFWQREQWTPAMGCYQQVLIRDPQQAKAHQRLAEGFEKAGEVDKALVHYRQAYEIVVQGAQPTHPLQTSSLEIPEDGEVAMLLVHLPRFNKRGKWLLNWFDRMKWATILAWAKPEEFPGLNPETSHQQQLSAVPQLPALPQNLIPAAPPTPVLQPAPSPSPELPTGNVVPFPGKPKSVPPSLEMILAQAKLDLKTGNWQQCMAACRQILAQTPKQAEAHKLLGQVLKAQGQLPQALQSFGNAMALEPLDIEVKVEMGDLFVQQQEWDKAIACYRAAIKQNSRLATVWERLGDLWLKTGKGKEAIAAYHQVIQLQPKRSQAYQKLGNAFQQQGQVNEANAAFQRATELS